MKVPNLRSSRLPRPLKWALAAVGIIVAYKLLLLVLAAMAIVVSLVWTAALLGLLAAIAYYVMRR